MTISSPSGLLRRRAPLIIGVSALSLLAGMALFYAQPRLYEVSMTLEVRDETLMAYSEPMPAIIRHLVESGSINKKLAAKAGIAKGGPLPALKAGVGFHDRLVKIYSYVPSDRIEVAQAVFNSLVPVLNEEFPPMNADYFRRITRLNSNISNVRKFKDKIDREMKDTRLSPGQLKLASDLSDLAGELYSVLEAAETLRVYSQTLNAFDFRIVVPLSVSDVPAGPSGRQAFIAFALLAIFSGLAAALWAEERDNVGK